MVETVIDKDMLRVRARGTHKLLAFKNSIEIPLRAIRSVKADPARAKHAHGIRFPGTRVPGVLTAGTFRDGARKIFWDVHNPNKAIVIELSNPSDPKSDEMLRRNRYDELIVEVPNPTESVEQITRAIAVQ
jgi:hypothetical protein